MSEHLHNAIHPLSNEIELFDVIANLLASGYKPTIESMIDCILCEFYQALALLIHHDDDNLFFSRIHVSHFDEMFSIEELGYEYMSPFECLLEYDDKKAIKTLLKLDLINPVEHHSYIQAAIKRQPYEKRQWNKLFMNRGYQAYSFKPRYL